MDIKYFCKNCKEWCYRYDKEKGAMTECLMCGEPGLQVVKIMEGSEVSKNLSKEIK